MESSFIHHLPYDNLVIIIEYLMLDDIVHLGNSCKHFKSSIDRFISESPLHSKMIGVAKLCLLFARMLSEFDIVHSERFFSTNQQEAENLIYYCLIDSKKLNESGKWTNWIDIQHSMENLRDWIYSSFRESKLEVYKSQVWNYAKRAYDIKNPELRKRMALEIGSNVPHKVTKAIMDEKCKYVTKTLQSVTSAFKISEIGDLDATWQLCRDSLQPYILNLLNTVLVLMERYNSKYMMKTFEKLVKNFPEINSVKEKFDALKEKKQFVIKR
jgi:hypothetical protein